MSNNYVSGAKRKLIPEELMIQVFDLVELGVPLAKVLKDKKLNACRPVISKLLDSYRLATESDCTITAKSKAIASMFPKWLDNKELIVQEQPDGWKYAGRFPMGMWLSPEDLAA